MKKLIAYTAGVTMAFGLFASPAAATSNKITLCHATGSATNPYVSVTVDDDSIWKNGQPKGHAAHQDNMDIIPPFSVSGPDFPGLNWTADNQLIHANGCVASVPGPQGPEGPAGPAGPQGPQGPPGEPGTNGNDGKDGNDGADGLTPHIICFPGQGLGYTYTPDEFLNTDTEYLLEEGAVCPLVGPKGDRGKKGKPGVDGQNGTNGADGKDGVNGTDGKNGADGKDGKDGNPGYSICPDGTVAGAGIIPNCAPVKGEKGDKGDTGPAGPQGPAATQPTTTINPADTPTETPTELPHTGLGDWLIWAGVILAAAGLAFYAFSRLFNQPDSTDG